MVVCIMRKENKTMREIEFRGKYDLNSEFTYGNLIHGVGSKSNKMYILPNVINLAKVKNCHPLDGVSVIPETIGQYTGLKDKNGTKIFEGDILEWVSCNPFSKGEIRKVQVYYIEAHFWCKGTIGVYLGELLVHEKCEVIGNIHDNPELLKGE